MLLKKLVEIKSPSGEEEELKKFVRSYLENLGYDVIEEDFYLAVNTKRDLIVATHLDTVNTGIPFSSDGVYAYGSGVCDAKASLAAMLLAAERGIDYTLAFLCDEEEGGRGSMEFAEKWKWGEMAIVMEPTELKIVKEHFGNLDVVVEVKGKSAHGSMPEWGVNAIDKACELISEIRKFFKVIPTKIDGGGDEYVIPDTCRMKLDILLEPEKDTGEAIELLNRVITKYGGMKVEEAYRGFYCKKVCSLLKRALEECGIKAEHTVMPSWTDALNLKDRFDVTVWGPGELHYCHTTKERIRLDDVEKTKNVLIKLNELI